MKKKLFLTFLILALCGAFLNAQTLDEAILNAAVKISRDLPAGVTAAVIDFKSDSDELNAYVINGLHGAIIRNRRITSVRIDQEQLRSVREGLHYNAAGELSVESAQNTCWLLGAQYLVTGSLERTGSDYRIAFNAVDTSARLQSQYTASLDPRNDAQLASLLGITPASSVASASQQATAGSSQMGGAQDEAGQRDKLVSFKFSLGLTLGFFSYELTERRYYYTDSPYESYSAAYFNLITPTLSLRLLYSPENKLRLGIGVDVAYSLVMIQIESLNDAATNMAGSLASYAIIGYGNIYLHAGYDWVGALYLAPTWAINKHLLIGIPMSLFGSNQLFGILQAVFPPDSYAEGMAGLDTDRPIKNDLKAFQIGISIQYVF